jgi:UDP-glucuronate decarboxylase
VVSNFVVQALRGEDITLYGDGRQTRSFCYVSDLVDGLVSLMQSDEIGPVNLGNPGEFTIAELAQLVVAQTGSRSRIVYRALPTDDPRQRRPNIEKAEQRLGYAPKIPLHAGLAPTIDYFRTLLSSAKGSEAPRRVGLDGHPLSDPFGA